MTLPLATIERLMKQAGKIRVGADGAGEMQAILDKKLASVTEKAAVLAKHAGRKTIKAEDVRLANEQL